MSAGAGSVEARIVLAACRLAVEVTGRSGGSSTIAVSARVGMRSLRVSLPSSLRLRAPRGRSPGRVWFKAAAYPERRFALTGPRTSVNGVKVVLSRRGIRVSGLPPETGVVRLRLDPRVLSGRGGLVRAGATLRGDRAPTQASGPAAWTG